MPLHHKQRQHQQIIAASAVLAIVNVGACVTALQWQGVEGEGTHKTLCLVIPCFGASLFYLVA